MRLIEIRLLEGPNVYRLEPIVKVEVAIGRRRTWYGQRVPGRHAVVRLGAAVAARTWPDEIAAFVAWARRLRTDHGEGTGGVAVHRSSDPGHWIVTWPWHGAERARTIAEAALGLTERSVSPGRRVHLTGTQARLIERWSARIAAASTSPPSWIRDADRTIPIVSVSGTNGKSTTSRLITHVLRVSGRRVGTTTSDGVLVDERMVEPGDWTGPAGAAQILGRADIDVAVLETARGGMVLRGVGYESNDASVLTNVTSDHLDLQGIHTLPELAEVKATICRITRPDGWVILNADDPFVAAVARRVRARVAFFSLHGDRQPVIRRHLARGGRAYIVTGRRIVEAEGDERRTICEIAEIPITVAGLARHNVANALAAAGGARALGATLAELADGLRNFRPSSERSPGRLNLYALGEKVVIVDFAHNEAGVEAILDVAEGIAGGAAGRRAPVTVIVGTAGDRPDDTLRGIGRIAGARADRVVVKETLAYLRGRARQAIVGEILVGIAAGRAGRDRAPDVAASGGDEIPVYESEIEALRAELALNDPDRAGGRGARVIVLMCHQDRDAVFELLRDLGARPVETTHDLLSLVPRLQDRPRR